MQQATNVVMSVPGRLWAQGRHACMLTLQMEVQHVLRHARASHLQGMEAHRQRACSAEGVWSGLVLSPTETVELTCGAPRDSSAAKLSSLWQCSVKPLQSMRQGDVKWQVSLQVEALTCIGAGQVFCDGLLN